MKRITKLALVIALAMTLVVVLAGCGSSGTSSSSASGSSQTESTSAPTTSAGQPEASSAAASTDVSSWKTLGDALAAASGNPGSTFDDNHYVAVYAVGDKLIRVVAKMKPGMYNTISSLDMLADDYLKKLADHAGDLELESVEDITANKLSQDELNVYIGKTGQDLINDGFKFSNYYYYGGNETGAAMDKGYLCYGVTFNVGVPDNQPEDNGAAIKDATIKAIEFMGASDSALHFD